MARKIRLVDFAGSSVIHMVGGIASVIGAAMLGPVLVNIQKEKTEKLL